MPRKSTTSATDIATRYAHDVIAGKIVAGKLVRRAAERHCHDVENGADRGIYFDQAAASHAIRFFGFLRHSKGEWAGKPLVLSPWQQFRQSMIFGWRRDDGTRRFRTAYGEVARKNGKSTEAAGDGLYLMVADNEPGAEVYAAATTKKQARIVHAEAKRMVKASPAIAKLVTVQADNLHVVKTASKFEPLTAEADKNDGLNVHGAIIDELHAHPTRELYDVIETATAARRQPLIFCITTAGFNQDSICWELREYALAVLDGFDKPDGHKDDSFFPLIYTIDAEDDWRDETCWPKANPNLNVSVKLDDLQRLARKAQRMASAQNNFRTKHLDEWVGQEVLWIDMEAWDRCAGPVSREALRGQPCYGGLDLSTTRDISAFVLVFPLAGGRFAILPHFWIPAERAAEREKRDRVHYRHWAEQKLIKCTPARVIDYDVIRADIKQAGKEFAIKEIGFDPWNATQIATQLGETDGFQMVEMRQGYATLSGPSKELEKLCVEGKLAHAGHPVLRWMASNVAVRDDGNGNIRPVKPAHDSPKKIDGIVGAVMALGRAIVHPTHQSVYETRGVLTI